MEKDKNVAVGKTKMVKKTPNAKKMPAFVPVVDDSFGEPQTELEIAKEIIGYLLSKLPEETGKGIDRAKGFIS